MNLTMDGGAREADLGLKTWGELLASVESGQGPNRRVVTAVRFDGVVQPSFREPKSLEQTLQESGAIDIETSTIRDLIETSAAVAIEQVPVLVAMARQTGHAFRRHDIDQGHRALEALLAGLRTLAALTSMLQGAKAAITGNPAGLASPSPLEALERALASMADTEASQDWIAMADLLEYDIAAALPRWLELL